MGSYCEYETLVDIVASRNSEKLVHEHVLRFDSSTRHSGLMV